MATVRAFKIPGAKAWFWSHDHEPPHFHVKRQGAWEIRVYFLLAPSKMIEVKWAKKAPSQRVLDRIARLAEKHREELLRQWEQIQGLESNP